MKFSNSAPRDCSDVALQLTALFDGEADAEQTSQARAHLLSCPACSRQWLDWTRYRDTLQSEPKPAVPPTLLWRVLIAYRVTAFVRPARRRSRLPLVSAAPLRGIEAPLPPRLSQHILARTTRKPNAHVMLTPLQSAPTVAPSRFKGRSFSFGAAPLWAAPALALWILMLSRADFNATLPVGAPDATIAVAPTTSQVAAPRKTSDAAAKRRIIAPLPIALGALARVPVATAPGVVAPGATAATSRGRLNNPAQSAIEARRATPLTTNAAPVARPTSGTNDFAQQNFGRTFVLALSAGRNDVIRPRTGPRVASNSAPVAPVAVPVAPSQTPSAQPAEIAARPTRPERAVSAEAASSRVMLAALASPISSVRTLSSARLRTAAFSDDSMRPRVAHARASGRRLARLAPEEDAANLRVSRPIVQAPTLRETNFANADNGPKLDELRSAVDDFRASVAGDE